MSTRLPGAAPHGSTVGTARTASTVSAVHTPGSARVGPRAARSRTRGGERVSALVTDRHGARGARARALTEGVTA
ncbi:hypothetical protein AN218_23270 [Streptomyces nanshensis]|uniref:Uncharacterized protein n=1 Tax=Streptomyces nanshensis TaxID=518642 RepID=A0A1E7KZ38_9ACTN|nr:hypothetical protein AN218_23270 [Streptomyces nanshensis]